MRITLLHPPRTGGAGTNLVPPMGLLYLGAVLEKAGHIVSLVDAALTGHTDKILQDDIIETAPDLLMISAFTSDVFLLRPQITNLRRMLPETPFWLGGPHASCAGLQVLIDFPEIDAFFMGESEESVLELISSDSSEKAPDGVVLRTAPSATHPRHIHDLASEGWKKFHNTTCAAPPDTISRKRMKHLQRKAFLSFYLRPRPFLRVIGLFYHKGSSGRLLRRILAYLMTGKEY